MSSTFVESLKSSCLEVLLYSTVQVSTVMESIISH